MLLNIGCSHNHLKDYLNIDIDPSWSRVRANSLVCDFQELYRYLIDNFVS
jgi:hypothetical protein